MLFCMLYVVNPITTGPNKRKPIDILSRLVQILAPKNLVKKAVNLFSPWIKHGKMKRDRPKRKPNGAKTKYPEADSLLSPASTTGR